MVTKDCYQKGFDDTLPLCTNVFPERQSHSQKNNEEIVCKTYQPRWIKKWMLLKQCLSLTVFFVIILVTHTHTHTDTDTHTHTQKKVRLMLLILK